MKNLLPENLISAIENIILCLSHKTPNDRAALLHLEILLQNLSYLKDEDKKALAYIVEPCHVMLMSILNNDQDSIVPVILRKRIIKTMAPLLDERNCFSYISIMFGEITLLLECCLPYHYQIKALILSEETNTQLEAAEKVKLNQLLSMTDYIQSYSKNVFEQCINLEKSFMQAANMDPTTTDYYNQLISRKRVKDALFFLKLDCKALHRQLQAAWQQSQNAMVSYQYTQNLRHTASTNPHLFFSASSSVAESSSCSQLTSALASTLAETPIETCKAFY